jgi:hypothetical protein
MARFIVSSSRELGNSRERNFEARLWAHGYKTARFSGSGQKVSDGRKANGLAGDLIALAPEHSNLPHLLAEIGGTGKRLRSAFAVLQDRPNPPGFTCVVVKCVRRKWQYFTSAGSRFDSFETFIGALKT